MNLLFIATETCHARVVEYLKSYQGPRFGSEWKMLRQITPGLEHLHELEIVYRDIKPINILIFVPEGDSYTTCC